MLNMRFWIVGMLVSLCWGVVGASATTPELLSQRDDGGGRLANFASVGYRGGESFPTGKTPTRTFSGDVTITERLTLKSGDYWRCNPGAVLHIPVSLYQAVGKGSGGGTYGWTWDGAFFEARGADGVLVENCVVQFDGAVKYQGHEGGERGYNAWGIYGSKNVYLKTTVRNADNAVFFGSGSQENTVELRLERVGRPTAYPPGASACASKLGCYGHYGVKLASSSHHNLVRADLRTTFFHDISVAGGANTNVVNVLYSDDVNFDHHRSSTGPQHNLFMGHVGLGNRIFASSGPYKEGYKNSGPWEVFWGLHKTDGSSISSYPNVGTSAWDAQYVVIPHRDRKVTETKWWQEAIPFSDLTPQDLYRWQRGESPVPPAEPPPADPGDKFTVGQGVKTTTQVNVRQAPGTNQPLVGTQPKDALATVLAGPVPASGYVYWSLEFTSGVYGWVGEDKLTAAP